MAGPFGDDSGNVECRDCLLGSELVLCVTGLIFLYAILITICTCFLFRRLRWYKRNTGREPPLARYRVDTDCPPKRACSVELMCCCFGCKLVPTTEENRGPLVGTGPPASADGVGVGNGYERVVSHRVVKPDDYYIVPEGSNGIGPRRTEDSGASNIYEEIPDRRNFSRYATPEQSSGLSGAYTTVLHSGATSQRVSVKSGLSSSVSYSGVMSNQGVARPAPRLDAAGQNGIDEDNTGSTFVESEYQPLLSGGAQRTATYTDLHEECRPTQAESLPVSVPTGGGVKMKELVAGESATDDEAPLVPRKYHTVGSTREKPHT